jgi:hypothetical protein
MNRDPETGQERDFKFLHLQDVQMSFAGVRNAGWWQLRSCQR